MTTVKQHLDKVKKKAHSTQKKNGQYLKMTIARLSNSLKKKNEYIKELEGLLNRSISQTEKALELHK